MSEATTFKALDEVNVRTIFRALLGREPESDRTIQAFLAMSSFAEVIRTITESAEFRQGKPIAASSPFDHYTSLLDVHGLVRRNEDPARRPRDGFKVNYFGVAVPTHVIPSEIVVSVPDVEIDPLPANWHADAAEFAAVLRAVELAHSNFTIVELGCGWGCWMSIAGRCAARSGRTIKLVGVEGDGKNLALAQETMVANGFSPNDIFLVHGIVAARSGRAAFPQQSPDGQSWGLEPVFDDQPLEFQNALESGRYIELAMHSVDELAQAHGRIDLIHIDIQGGEATLVKACMPALIRNVGYAVIGTHSREIEGELIRLFREGGWVLEVERPAIHALHDHARGPFVIVDGVQGWRNPAAAPA